MELSNLIQAIGPLEVRGSASGDITSLTYDAEAQTLTCTECRRIFRIDDGIPVLLLDEALLPDETDTKGD